MAPGTLNKTQVKKWNEPWKVPLSRFRARPFKKKLWDAGYLSPNFKRSEAACEDGTPVPEKLRHAAQRHAFALERVRHELGDKPMSPISWYRTPAHNTAVGGASKSQHVKARATDFSEHQVTNDYGKSRWNMALEKVFKKNGLGMGRGGAYAHCDSRNWLARWWY